MVTKRVTKQPRTRKPPADRSKKKEAIQRAAEIAVDLYKPALQELEKR